MINSGDGRRRAIERVPTVVGDLDRRGAGLHRGDGVFRPRNAFEQAELILRAALDPTIAQKARRGEFVKYLDHFDLLQSAIN